MSAGLPCLRCGDFVVPETAPIPGIELCAKCLEPARPAGPGTVLPPRELYWRQLWPILMFPLAASGAAVYLLSNAFMTIPDRVGQILVFAIVLITGGWLGMILGAVVANTALANRGYGAWKATAFERLGVRTDPRFALVYCVDRNQPLPAFNDPGDLGLLTVAVGGLAFVGVRGTRLALPLARVRGVVLERLRTNLPWRTALRVDFDEGTIFFAFLEATTFRANRARAEATANLIRGWIYSSVPPST